jgi:hypothetical protein
MDPPEEYGVAVNFGNSNVGSGNIQPKKPVKSEPRKVNKEPQIETSKSEPTKSSETKEDILTQETEDAIAIKKQKEAEDKAKAETERIEKAKAEAEERERKDKEEKKKKLDALIGGVKKSDGKDTGSEGNDNQQGDKGQLDGNPYGPYKGTPGSGNGGIGYGLNGRGNPKHKVFDGCENQYGLIVVEIVVNQNGNVIEANSGAKGSSNITTCLKAQAKKIAMSYKWPPNSKAPVRQYGKVSVKFTSN